VIRHGAARGARRRRRQRELFEGIVLPLLLAVAASAGLTYLALTVLEGVR
jgi:hypothetical protein